MAAATSWARVWKGSAPSSTLAAFLASVQSLRGLSGALIQPQLRSFVCSELGVTKEEILQGSRKAFRTLYELCAAGPESLDELSPELMNQNLAEKAVAPSGSILPPLLAIHSARVCHYNLILGAVRGEGDSLDERNHEEVAGEEQETFFTRVGTNLVLVGSKSDFPGQPAWVRPILLRRVEHQRRLIQDRPFTVQVAVELECQFGDAPGPSDAQSNEAVDRGALDCAGSRSDRAQVLEQTFDEQEVVSGSAKRQFHHVVFETPVRYGSTDDIAWRVVDINGAAGTVRKFWNRFPEN